MMVENCHKESRNCIFNYIVDYQVIESRQLVALWGGRSLSEKIKPHAVKQTENTQRSAGKVMTISIEWKCKDLGMVGQ